MTTAVRLPTRVEINRDQSIRRQTRAILDAPAQYNYRVVSADYTIQDADDVVLVAGAATKTITLPAPSTVSGRTYSVVRVGTGAITLEASDGSLLSGSATRPIGLQWDCLTLLACSTDGGTTFAWVIV